MKKNEITEEILQELLDDKHFISTKDTLKFDVDGHLSFFQNFEFPKDIENPESFKYHKWEDFERKYNGLQAVNITGTKMSYSSNEDDVRTLLPGIEEVFDVVMGS